jgi:HK97 family phage portal protein
VQINADGDRIRYSIAEPKEELLSGQMLHVAGMGGDGIRGWSVVEYARQSLGAAIAADQYQSSLFGNKATPAGVLKHPMKLDKPAREHLRREWNEIHQGSGNAGRVAIMHGGMEFQAVGMTNEDAQFLQSRNFSIREIARWFRLPPHMLADLQDSSVRANIEQQAIEFIVYSMAPWLIRWQQTLNRKLLNRDERRTMYFEFLLESLLQGDSAAQAQAWSVGRQWGWYSVNDIRYSNSISWDYDEIAALNGLITMAKARSQCYAWFGASAANCDRNYSDTASINTVGIDIRQRQTNYRLEYIKPAP